MRLYHVSVGAKPGKHRFYPRIPAYRLGLEDDETKRICFSDSIERALAASPDIAKVEDTWITVYALDVDESDQSLISWCDVWAKYGVADAYFNHEYWYLRPVTLSGVCYRVDLIDAEKEKALYADMKEVIYQNLMFFLQRGCYIKEEINEVQRLVRDNDALDVNLLYRYICKRFPELEYLVLGGREKGTVEAEWECAIIVTKLQLVPIVD